jgi:putative membrane protein insertion efficiency factor
VEPEAPRLNPIFRVLIAPLLGVIWLWQLTRPIRPPTCRFYPACSDYAATALRMYGPFKGGWLSVVRIAKCQPFHPGGFDPVPGTQLPEPHDHDHGHAHPHP